MSSQRNADEREHWFSSCTIFLMICSLLTLCRGRSDGAMMCGCVWWGCAMRGLGSYTVVTPVSRTASNLTSDSVI